MVAGQSCIAGPLVSPPRATLDGPARHTFLVPACAQKTCRLCLLETRVSGVFKALQTRPQSVRNVLEGERKLHLRYGQATYQFLYITLVVYREQAFLCFQKHSTWLFPRRKRL
jgi:hypothetical protein